MLFCLLGSKDKNLWCLNTEVKGKFYIFTQLKEKQILYPHIFKANLWDVFSLFIDSLLTTFRFFFSRFDTHFV